MDERTRKFIAHLPISQRVSIRKAAEILDDEDAAQELLSLVANGHLFSWTHCPVSGDAHISINHSLGIQNEKQQVTPDTDPAKVLLEGEEVRWRWCVSYEAKLQYVDHPAHSTVEARERIVLEQARAEFAKAGLTENELRFSCKDVQAAPVQTAEPVPKKKATPKPITNWRMLIQAEASEYWIRLLASGCSPTVHSILDDMAKWCVTKDVRTDTGIYPSAGHIKNTVLGGGHWPPPTISREQAKKHVAHVA